jgi:pilus assembly protein CpaB
MNKRVLGLALAAVLAVIGIVLITAAARNGSGGSDRASPSPSTARSGAVEVAAGPADVAPAARQAAPAAGSPAPADLVRLTLQLEPQRALGGLLRAGDKVAVAASFDGGGASNGAANQTAVLLEKVLVVNVQVPSTDTRRSDESGDKAKAEASPETTIPSGNLLVTLAVPPAEAKRLVFASEYGRVWLAAEADAAAAAGGAAVSRANVLSEPAP